jgi:MFS family permease
MATLSVAAPASSRNPMRNPGFRLLWTGRAISVLGDQFYLVALPWLILQHINSAVTLGTIMMTAALPQTCLMLVGGVMSDRISPRRILLTTTSARMLCVALIGALAWFHVLQLWQIYALVFLFGVADAFALPASQAFLPSLVDSEQLASANSITQITQQLATIIGPAPAGFVVRSLGTAVAFFIDAVSFLFVIAALWRLPDPPKPAASPKRAGMLRSILDGLAHIKDDTALSSLLLVAAALNFSLSGPVSIGIVWMSKQTFGTPVALSVCVSAVAAGGIIGAILAGVFKSRMRGRLLVAVSGLIALCTAPLGSLASLWALAADLLIMSMAAGYLNVQIIAWLQQRVDREYRGRTMSVVMFAAVGLQPLSLALAGFAVKFSISGMFLGAAALMLAVTTIAALQRPVREID